MAYLKSRGVNKLVTSHQDYLEKEGRACERSTYNLFNDDNWGAEMVNTKLLHGKTDGRQYQEFIQSFDPQDDPQKMSPKAIHKMGREWAKKYADQGWEIAIITHNDKDHIHNHIIINSVHPETGDKFHLDKKGLQAAMKANDRLCENHGYLTLDQSKALKDEQNIREGIQPTVRLKNQSRMEDMQARLQKVFSDRSIKTARAFEEALTKHRISISRTTSKGKITYLDLTNNIKYRADKLGAFNRDDIAYVLDRNQKLEQAQKQALEARNQSKREEERTQSKISIKQPGRGGMER